jgi:hypothetical protein
MNNIIVLQHRRKLGQGNQQLIGGRLSGSLFAIPKQAFVVWLAIHNFLTTGDRLLKWCYKGDVQCVSYRNGLQSIFFKCVQCKNLEGRDETM